MTRHLAVAAIAAATALALSSCGTPSIAKRDLERNISNELEKQVGQKPDHINCPGDLTGKVGKTMECTLVAGDDQLPVEVKVTSVKGTRVNFSAKVLSKK